MLGVFENTSAINSLYLCLSDISECQVDTLAPGHSKYSHDCHSDANCTNTKGSYYCTCDTGYSGNGVTCVGNEICSDFLQTFRLQIDF